MLSFPVDQDLTSDDIALLTPSLARSYARLSERTLVRDLEVLMRMDLIAKTGDGYRARADALRFRMPRRLPVGLF